MNLVKFCKAEHNIRDVCNTIQLGTFSYYREMDPNFSIADAEEGFVRYECNPDPDLTIDSAQWNAITGGGVVITDNASPPGSVSRPVGPVKFKSEGDRIVFGEDGKAVINPGKLNVELYYPNCYIFCCSIDNEGEEPDPRKVSPEYDSFYRINGSHIDEFGSEIAAKIQQNLSLGDISLGDERLAKSHITTLGQPFHVRCLHGLVNYSDDKVIRLQTADDFSENAWHNIFFNSMFRKNGSYSTDREYRFVFIIEHSLHRFLPVKDDPKIMELNKIRSVVR